MDTLRSLIRKKRIKNEDRHWFIPHGTLDSCLTPKAIYGCLASCGIDSWSLQELTTTITCGSKKVFAVLLLIGRERDFVCFVEDDGFQNASLDSRLPFALSDLRRILGETAEEFFEEQWQLIAPRFTRHLTHRYFQSDIILPFILPRLLGDGAFGQVFDVTIVPGHHDYEEDGRKTPSEIHVARKELYIHDNIPESKSEGAWQSEQRVLSALHHMKNPCILELLASYTYRGKHYLLFPVASGGDLKAFLTAEDRPPSFAEDANIWKAMSGLASALQTVHTYNSTILSLKMIGYHNDISPKNILISGDHFILSDFGLSKLEEREHSKTTFKIGGGFYLAPECENHQLDFAKGTISRASDVWSLGCVVLEVLVFMLYGSDGIQKFRDDRKTRVGTYTTKTFFTGDKINVGVEDWLQKISDSADITCRKATSVIRSMLTMEPGDRPTANQVKLCLRLLSVESNFRLAKSAIFSLAEKKTFDILLEEVRLKAWGSILGLGLYMGDDLDFRSAQSLEDDARFSIIIATLQGVRESSLQPSDLSNATSFRIRVLVDQLFNQLSTTQYQGALSLLETMLISSWDQHDAATTEHWPPELDIRYFEASKQLCALNQKGSVCSNPGLKIYKDALRDWEPFQACIKAKLFRNEQQAFTPVLIEWIVYDKHWTGEVGEKLFKRVGTVVEIIQNVFTTQLFPILNCRGYFHAADRRAFGLVYELPLRATSDPARSTGLLSLNQLIASTKDVRHRPLLDDLLGFARDLAQALLKLHKVGWLHKAFNSYNIIFVHDPAQQSVSTLLRLFQIVGFNHSRPDQPNEYTEGAWAQSKTACLYQDPEYLKEGSRYSPELDYFSFGLVLLEVGMWKCLNTMLPVPGRVSDTDHGLNAFDSTEHLLTRWVPLLGPRMGRRYKNVVSRCLRKAVKLEQAMDEIPADVPPISNSAGLAFEKYVVQDLEDCKI